MRSSGLFLGLATSVSIASVALLATAQSPAPSSTADAAPPPSLLDAGGDGPTAPVPDAGADADADIADASDAGDSAPADAPGPTVDEDAGDPSVLPVATGFAFGVRAGWAIPFGLANRDAAFSDVVKGAFLLGIDAGYFFNEHLYVGGYLLYGFPTIAGAFCDPTLSCSANMFRFGATADWHFAPHRRMDPYGGIGLGYDILNLTSADDTGASVGANSLHGFDATLQAGLDFRVASSFGGGPFVEMALGHYASDESSTTTHGWVTIGLRVRTGL